jgi:two-component sensor histidine kinase
VKWSQSHRRSDPLEREQGNGPKVVSGTIQQLGGTIDYDWRPEGLIARLRLPIASLAK